MMRFEWLDILATDQKSSKPDLEKCFRLKNGLILDHSGVAHLPARECLLPSTVKHQVKKPVLKAVNSPLDSEVKRQKRKLICCKYSLY